MTTPAVETQPERDDSALSFTQRMQRYQVELAIADRAANPWLTTAERNAVKLVIGHVKGGARAGSTTVFAPNPQVVLPIGVVPKANVVKVGG